MTSSNRKIEITEVAARLFRNKGYAAVSMRDLAAAMDMKAASLYNHITSKQEVLALVIMDLAAAFTTGIQEIDASNDSIPDKLAQVIKLHIDLTLLHPNAMASLNNDWMHLSHGDLAIFLEQRNTYEGILRTMLRSGVKKGELRQIDEEVVLFSTLSTLRSLYLWYGKRSNMKPDELRQQLIDVLLHGVVH